MMLKDILAQIEQRTKDQTLPEHDHSIYMEWSSALNGEICRRCFQTLVFAAFEIGRQEGQKENKSVFRS